jgi:hypothetical protein
VASWIAWVSFPGTRPAKLSSETHRMGLSPVT